MRKTIRENSNTFAMIFRDFTSYKWMGGWKHEKLSE